MKKNNLSGGASSMLKLFSICLLFSCHSYISDGDSLPQVYSINIHNGDAKYFCKTKFKKETVYFSFTDSINKFQVGDTIFFTKLKPYDNKKNAGGASK